MTPEEIKAECSILAKTIKDAKDRWDELRKLCPHQNTRIGLFSYDGNVSRARRTIICTDCSTPKCMFEELGC